MHADDAEAGARNEVKYTCNGASEPSTHKKVREKEMKKKKSRNIAVFRKIFNKFVDGRTNEKK